MKLREWVNLETVTGEAVQAGDLLLRPQAQVLRLRWPWGGYVFNRPVGVLIDDGEQVTRIPVIDATRIAQITLLSWAGVFMLLGWRAQLKKEG